MVDFVCPECGSIDHVDGEVVRYPHLCPGCERIIQADRPPFLEAEAEAVHPVQLRLLPKEQWTAKKPKPELGPETRSGWHLTRGSLVFPALLFPVIAVTAYVWLKYPDLTDASHRPRLQVAAQASPAEPGPKAPVAAKPSRTSEKDIRHAVRRIPEDESPANEQTQEPGGAAAIEPPVQAAPPEAAESRPASTSAPPAQPEPSLTPRGVTTARPLYGGVPIVNEPSWQGREIVVASAMDILLILDRRVHNEWLHVIHVNTGREGWVRVSQVRITANGE